MRYLLRLRVFLRTYLRQVIAALLLLGCITAIDFIFPQIIQQVIDTGLKGGVTNYLLYAALLIALLFLVQEPKNSLLSRAFISFVVALRSFGSLSWT